MSLKPNLSLSILQTTTAVHQAPSDLKKFPSFKFLLNLARSYCTRQIYRELLDAPNHLFDDMGVSREQIKVAYQQVGGELNPQHQLKNNRAFCAWT
ncbi:uncharacterized protein YjiS (DUF1127 family) [Labrenzia sp. EL_142]|nr:uncharacterized protein YjiS (DUF1127 family) [Labrenzia sp. EL_142]